MKDPSGILKQLESGYSLPSLSPVAMRLVELASDETCSAEDLVKLIEKDPSMAVRLLKLANSAFFRSKYPVSTLNQAVVKVGISRLRVMALSISIRDTFPMGKMGPMDYERFWRISLYRGLIAKSLAAILKTINPDEAFIAGLIREIGLLIFFDLFVKGESDATTLSMLAPADLLSWEKRKHGLTHRQIGKIALTYWKFPENIISCQDPFPTANKSEKHQEFMKLCELADSLSHILFQKTGSFSQIYENALTSCNIEQEKLNDILIETFDQVEEIAESLNVEVNRERDLMEILEKANRALSRISEKIFLEGGRNGDQNHLPTMKNLDKGDDIVTYTLQAVAHKIRNPLLAVGGFARRLSDSLDPETSSGKYIRIILEESERLEKALSEMTHETTAP